MDNNSKSCCFYTFQAFYNAFALQRLALLYFFMGHVYGQKKWCESLIDNPKRNLFWLTIQNFNVVDTLQPFYNALGLKKFTQLYCQIFFHPSIVKCLTIDWLPIIHDICYNDLRPYHFEYHITDILASAVSVLDE